MIRQEDWDRVIQAYLGGEATREERAAVEELARTNADFREELEGYREVVHHLDAVAFEAFRAGFDEKFPPPKVTARIFEQSVFRRLLVASIAALLMLGVWLWLGARYDAEKWVASYHPGSSDLFVVTSSRGKASGQTAPEKHALTILRAGDYQSALEALDRWEPATLDEQRLRGLARSAAWLGRSQPDSSLARLAELDLAGASNNVVGLYHWHQALASLQRQDWPTARTALQWLSQHPNLHRSTAQTWLKRMGSRWFGWWNG